MFIYLDTRGPYNNIMWVLKFVYLFPRFYLLQVLRADTERFD